MSLPYWLMALAWGLFGVIALGPLLHLSVIGWADDPSLAYLLSLPWHLLGNSLLVAGVASALAVVFGVPCAFVCARTDLKGSAFWSSACLTPLLIPPYLHALAWERLSAVFHRLSASYSILGSLDIHHWFGVALVLGMAYYPLVMLLTLSGLYSIDSRTEEAARVQQGLWPTISRITLPLVLPHILTGALLVFLFALLDFSVPDLLRVRVYTVEIFVQFSALYDQVGAVRLGLPLLVITAGGVALQVWLMRGRRYLCLSPRRRSARYPLDKGRIPIMLFLVSLVAASVLLPLASLVGQARPLASALPALATLWDTLLFSIIVAGVAAALMTGLAFIIAHQLVRIEGRRRLALEYLIHLPLALPAILLGIALIQIWNRPMTAWFYGSSGMVVLGYMAHFIPFAFRIVAAHCEQIHPHLEESALVLARPAQVITQISLPLAYPGLRIAFVVSFILALSELGVTLLVIPPGRNTIPITLYNYLHYGADSTVAFLSLLLVGLQMILIFGWFAVSRFDRCTPT